MTSPILSKETPRKVFHPSWTPSLWKAICHRGFIADHSILASA